jgi:uncharacterized protein (DUF2236 family)
MWKMAGDHRVYLMVPATSLLLNMLPGVSAGMKQHSVAFEDPFARFMRSIPQIMATLYDPEMSRRVRDYHHHVKGVDANGARYHALSPELYYASHAVFTFTMMRTIEVFDHRLSEDERVALYEDSKRWYRAYGISDRAMPETWAEFQDYWDHLTSEVMQPTAMAEFIADALDHPMVYKPVSMPTPVWRLLSPLLAGEGKLLARALMPANARQVLGWRLRNSDRAQVAAQATAIRKGWPLLPPAMRQSAAARTRKQEILAARA